MRTRYYVGAAPSGAREVFRATATPTVASHGSQYRYVIGPFRTKRGAEYLARYGGHDNPHLTCVADAERYARYAAVCGSINHD